MISLKHIIRDLNHTVIRLDLALCYTFTILIMISQVVQAQEDPWLDLLQNAKGMSVGTLEPRYPDLERKKPVGPNETDSDRVQETADTARAGAGKPDREKPTGPDTLDPNSQMVASLIRKWISTAKPPEDAIPENNVHYSNKGKVIGTVVGGIIESRHETGVSDTTYLWKNKRKLDSVDHCTMEEYVVARLKDESISHCARRYGAVTDLKGMRLSKAKAAVTGAGFEYSLVPGAPAKNQQQNSTIDRQKPDYKQYLKKGQTVVLYVRTPYSPKSVTLPNFAGKRLKDAKAWLKKKALKIDLQPGTPAPSTAHNGAVESQDPLPGVSVKAGTTVSLTIHAPYVNTGRVPQLVGLSVSTAKEFVSKAGFKVSIKPGGKPSSRAQVGTVARQIPEPGTTLSAGGNVTLFVYGPYVVSVAVPNMVGLSFSDAKRELEAIGLSIDQRDAGRPNQKRQANTVQKQDPPTGANVARGHLVQLWIFGDYVATREEQVAKADCSRFPESRAYWDNAAGKPMCGCFDGFQWNLTNTACVSQDDYAKEACARDYPGSVPRGRAAGGNINCDCPQGTTWNSDRTRCVRQLSPQELCTRDYPGSIPAGRNSGGRINCDCPQGFVWANDPRRCIKNHSRIPDRAEKCNHLIFQIKNFLSMYRQDPDNNAHLKGVAKENARQARALGCNQGQINQALGSVRGDTGDNCPCIDEQGRRYRAPLGQDCGTDLGAWGRDYNCSESSDDVSSNNDRRRRVKKPGSCVERGVKILYNLIDPPPYSGSSPICRDGSGQIWIQTGGGLQAVQRIIKGPNNRQTGCREGSKIITQSRTYDGRLCGP